MDAKKDIN